MTEAGVTFELRRPAPNARACGSCQLCCRLVPVASLHKRADERCKHQRHGKGCSIYARRPFECQEWNCAWLAREVHEGIGRPDRVHYVIDPMRDTVRLRRPEGDYLEVVVVQVWCDTLHPDAWQDLELKRMMLHWAVTERAGTLIRWGNARAMAVMPPPVSPTGDWILSEDSVPRLNGVGRYSQSPAHLRPPI